MSPSAVIRGAILHPPAVERAYRDRHLREDARLAAAVTGLVTVTYLALALNDLQLADDAAELRMLLVTRVVFGLVSLGLSGLMLRARRPLALDVAILAWVGSLALLQVLVQQTRPLEYYLPVIQDEAALLLVWAVLPGRLWVQVAGSWILTAEVLTWMVAFRNPPGSERVVLLAVTWAGSNAIGAMVAWRSNRARRAAYLDQERLAASEAEALLREEAIRESEAKLRAIAHGYPNGAVALFGEDDRVLLADGSSTFLGRPTSEVEGLGPSALVPGELSTWLSTALASARAGRTTVSEHPVDGRILEVTVSPARTPGVPSGMGIVVSQDITLRREVESRAALASRLSAMGSLVSGLAHELNNPLVAMTAGEGLVLEVAHDLLRELRGDAPLDRARAAADLGEAVEALEESSAAARRMAIIVRELAAFANPAPPRSRMRLGELVAGALERLPEGVAKQADVELVDRGSPEVMAAPEQIRSAIVHLVVNAARATIPGTRGKVTVRVETTGRGAGRIEVEDRGVGIPPEHMARLFDPFFTTHPAGRDRGAGLGLPVCHAVVSTHGGSITVSSEVGKGSTFRVELPAATVEAPAVAP